MLRLLLLRHAKSDRSDPGTRDRDRPINSRGREDAPRIGVYLARHALIPDRAIVSDARRARDTWQLVGSAFAEPPPVDYDERLYDASAQRIFDVIKDAGSRSSARVRTLLVVGHNPGLHAVAAALIASGDIEIRQRLLEKFPTSSLAVIEFEHDDWHKLRSRSGRLEHFVTARGLEAATD